MNIIRIVAVALMLKSLLSCTMGSGERVDPIGPPGSWWVGGDDGGVFVDVRDDGSPDDSVYIGTICFGELTAA